MVVKRVAKHRRALVGKERPLVGKAGAGKQAELAPQPPPEQELTLRAAAVVEGMKHAWGSYVKYAFGADELEPLTKSGKATLGGLGASVVDAM